MKIEKEILEKIEKAKVTAQKEYYKNCLNPVKRDWIKREDKDKICFAYQGTPDKAFVVFDKETRKVTARRQDFSIIETF